MIDFLEIDAGSQAETDEYKKDHPGWKCIHKTNIILLPFPHQGGEITATGKHIRVKMDFFQKKDKINYNFPGQKK
jgi:hypothetical protein